MGNDTVIVMSLKEGEVMNKNFNILKDSIQQLKTRIDTVEKKHVELLQEKHLRIKLQQEYDTVYKKYTVNKMLYEKREKDWKNERLYIAIITILPYALLFMIPLK